jgi:hypothetical protein
MSLLDKLAREQGYDRVSFPDAGFVISQRFATVGGLGGLKSMCGACRANTARPHPAGCAGTMYLPPDSGDLQSALCMAIKRLHLERDFGEVFPATNPLWYGLWVRSPLSGKTSEILGAVVADLAAQDSIGEPSRNALHTERICSDLRAFVLATEISQRENLPLHVSMIPPGHVDLGFYTIFAHCPNCKAEANLKRWQRRYPRELYTCRVCGRQYLPAATASREKMGGFDRDSLRQLLGGARFTDFAKLYLMARGYTAANAIAVITAAEAFEADREKKAAELRIAHERKDRFTQAVLYAGLHPTRLENCDEYGQSKFFQADEFAELLRRCRKYLVNIGFMFHESTNDALCVSAMHCGEQALLVFEQWRAKGCDEWFGASLEVPDSVVSEWTARA